jgi:hypothetical protein
MKWIGGRHAAANLMQKLDIQQLFGPGDFFAHYPSSHVFILQLLSSGSPVTLNPIAVPVPCAPGLPVVDRSPRRNVNPHHCLVFVVAVFVVLASRLKIAIPR